MSKHNVRFNCSPHDRFQTRLAVVTAMMLAVTSIQANCQSALPSAAENSTPPKTWIDNETGNRITRLTDEAMSKGLYFDTGAFTYDGQDMIYVSPSGIQDLNLATLQTTLLVAIKSGTCVPGTRTRRVFFQRAANTHLFAVDVDTKQVTQLGELPVRAIITSVNADETLVGGTLLEGAGRDYLDYEVEVMQETRAVVLAASSAMHDAMLAVTAAKGDPAALAAARIQVAAAEKQSAAARVTMDKVRSEAGRRRYASKTAEDIFTLNIRSGALNIVLKGNDWLNHVQFSPSDPALLMYAHEGPPEEADRIWTIHTDGTDKQLIHTRTVPRESVTHEFWSHDGKTIWYDLRKPLDSVNAAGKSVHATQYYLAGYNVLTQKKTIYKMTSAENSQHFNAAPDDSFFVGDGDRYQQYTQGNGVERRYIELLRPSVIQSSSQQGQPEIGEMRSTRLVTMKNNNYSKVEPNVRVSPDGKHIFFNSDMHGKTYIYSVDVPQVK